MVNRICPIQDNPFTHLKPLLKLYCNIFVWKSKQRGALSTAVRKHDCMISAPVSREGKIHKKAEKTREEERKISGVNGNPPVLGIDPSIGSHIKLQLLDITLPLSACGDGLDKKCLPKRMLLQGRYGFPALWEQQPHACCLLRNFLLHRVNPGALSSYWPTELLKKCLNLLRFWAAYGQSLNGTCFS